MADIRLLNSTSNIVRFTLKDKTTGQGKKGLTIATTGLVISTICDNEATPTVYTQAGGTLQTIATLGTYLAPSALNCRFKLVDDTNHPGLCEFQFADARFASSAGKTHLVISVNDAESTILDGDYEIQFGDAFLAMDYQQRNVAVTMPANPPTNFLIAGSFSANCITDAAILVPAVTTGKATTILAMVQQLWRDFFCPVKKDSVAKTKIRYQNDGTTVTITQPYTTTAGTDTTDTLGLGA
jgi:hypothetical protein